MSFKIGPNPDQIEVCLFGPGFGECAVIHVGNGSWVIVDSCIHSETSEPASLHYLNLIGEEIGTATKLIVATHWHDDHIRGLARVVTECENARFCASAALNRREFLASVCTYQSRHMNIGGSGVDEISAVIDALERSDGVRPLYRAFKDRPILSIPGTELAHGEDVKVTALSPSDVQFDKFITELTNLMPEVGQTRRRVTPQSPNHLSVVTWIDIGPTSLLFGGDLEETSDANTGWSVIVESRERPQGRATVFKVPHHGSSNAHNEKVWDKMLVEDPYAILTPFNRGKQKRPSSDDLQRLKSKTNHTYISSKTKPSRAHRRPAAVEKTIRDNVKNFRKSEASTGAIRLRNGGVSDFESWTVELFGPAYRA